MKMLLACKVLLTLVLPFILGCHPYDDSDADIRKEQEELKRQQEASYLKMFEPQLERAKKQTFIIQGVEVVVNSLDWRVYKKNYGPIKYEWIIIDTPSKRITYEVSQAFLDSKTSFRENLQPEEINLVLDTKQIKPRVFDLEIDEHIERFRLRNYLQLSRCRTSPIWKTLVDLQKGDMKNIYFSITSRFGIAKALVWDQKLKDFSSFVDLSPNFAIGGRPHYSAQRVIEAYSNIIDVNNNLSSDSQFFDFENYAAACDRGYSDYAYRERYDYLPRFDVDLDRVASSYYAIRTMDKFSTSMFPIYHSKADYEQIYKSEDEDYARSLESIFR